MYVCLSVCLRLFLHYRLEAAYERYQQLQCYKGNKNNVVILLKQLRSSIMSTGLPRPGLARSAHRGRIKLLRGNVSKSSAALNPLTITQLACELGIRGRLRMVLLGPSHQLAVRMRIMRIIVPRMRTHVSHAYSLRPAPRVSTLVPFIMMGRLVLTLTSTW